MARIFPGLPSPTGNDGYAIIEVSGSYASRAIKESYIVAVFEISSFSVDTGTLEIGASASLPSFAATYNRTPTSASLTDDEGNLAVNVTSSPAAFSSSFSFVKNTNNDSVVFTLTAWEDGDQDSDTETISWRPRTYWGVDVDGLSTESDIEGLSNSALDNNRNRSFSVTAGAGEHIYYAYPTSYGGATFTVGGFEGGFELVSSTISVTNTYGVTQDYRLYKSTNANLGSTTVVVT